MAINPDEAVALGAGVQAAIIAGQPIDSILVDVTPFSLGIEVASFVGSRVIPDQYKVLIRRNTTIPTAKEELFSTLHPEQDKVHVKVYQGEHPIASQNRLLGDFLIEGLEPETPGDLAKVTVSFDIDVNGMLRVGATDRKTGVHKTITVTASRERLSADEIAHASAQLAEIESAEIQALDNAEVDALLNRAQALLEGGSLSADQTEQLREKVQQVQAAHQAGDLDLLDQLSEELLDLLFDLEP
jgi:molecular chaperone DnaK